MILLGTVWQSKTNPASYGTEELMCNGTLNKFTDTRTGQITRVAACITPVPSGECYVCFKKGVPLFPELLITKLKLFFKIFVFPKLPLISLTI